MPKSWVERANTVPLKAIRDARRACYYPRTKGRPVPEIELSKNASSALHEYVHHVQAAAPDLDAQFAALHRRRTAGEPLVSVYDYPSKELGRRDKYISGYTGREYDVPGVAEGPKEVMTTSIEQVLHRPHGVDQVTKLLANDPEMLDLVLGLFFHYDPV